MRRLAAVLVAVLLPLPALAASTRIADLPAGHYVLDNTHSSLIAAVKHLGAANYVVRFDRIDGAFDYDPAHPEATRLTASVDVTSLDANGGYGKQFADQFLDAAHFPKATFVSTQATPGTEPGTGTLTGDLTLRGATHPLTLTVAFVGWGGKFPFGSVAGFSARGALKRSDYGSMNLASYVGDDVSLEIEGEFERQ